MPAGPSRRLASTVQVSDVRVADNRIVVVAPELRRNSISLLVPGIYRRANRRIVVLFERHQDIGIVMAGGLERRLGMPEHLPESSPRPDRSNTRSVIHRAVFGEEFDDLVVVPVIDAVRVSMDEIDDAVFVHESPKRCLLVRDHHISLLSGMRWAGGRSGCVLTDTLGMSART